jgi:thiamine biosynthesis protein ThiS
MTMNQPLLRILLNGEPREFSAPLTVQALLDELAIDPRAVAVELDRIVVKRALFGQTSVGDNAEVEIVSFVGGG